MISFALQTLRHRKAAFAGAFLALLCAAALVCACGMLLETGLRGTIAAATLRGNPGGRRRGPERPGDDPQVRGQDQGQGQAPRRASVDLGRPGRQAPAVPGVTRSSRR